MTRTTKNMTSKSRSLMDYMLILPLLPVAYSLTLMATHFVGILLPLLPVAYSLTLMATHLVGILVLLLSLVILLVGGVYWLHPGGHAWGQWQVMSMANVENAREVVRDAIMGGQAMVREGEGCRDGLGEARLKKKLFGVEEEQMSGLGMVWTGMAKGIVPSGTIPRNVPYNNNNIVIPGPHGLPFLGSLLSFATSSTPHRLLASLSSSSSAAAASRRHLMAFSLASTRLVVSSHPSTARSLLCSSSFSDRPLTQTARQLLFNRAIGFSPSGERWRRLRRLAASHLFSPRRIAAHQHLRQLEADAMLAQMLHSLQISGTVQKLRPFLQKAALNSIMKAVFGKRYKYEFEWEAAAAAGEEEAAEEEAAEKEEAAAVQRMVREGFELLGAFNMADHLPAVFESVDPLRIRRRCDDLVPQVYAFVKKIIEDHRLRSTTPSSGGVGVDSAADFVDVLLSLQEEEKLMDADIVSILWEMIFRGTDTMAILVEWILAELTLHQSIQEQLRAEVAELASEESTVSDAEVAQMAYLQAVVKEGLRMHPPGPLLSWARLAVHDTEVGGYAVPAGTTAMVNMWAITHDPEIWADPEVFEPARFLPGGAAERLEVGGADMRLAPFGAGARSCPGKAMAMATVQLWVARIVQRFRLLPNGSDGVDLSEVLKLSCEMATPLTVRLVDVRPPISA